MRTTRQCGAHSGSPQLPRKPIHLLHLELDRGLHFHYLVHHLLIMGEQCGEFPCLVQSWAEQARDLFDDTVTSKEGIVPLGWRGGGGGRGEGGTSILYLPGSKCMQKSRQTDTALTSTGPTCCGIAFDEGYRESGLPPYMYCTYRTHTHTHTHARTHTHTRIHITAVSQYHRSIRCCPWWRLR